MALYYARAVGRARYHAEDEYYEEWLAFWGESRRHLEGEVKARYGLIISSD